MTRRIFTKENSTDKKRSRATSLMLLFFMILAVLQAVVLWRLQSTGSLNLAELFNIGSLHDYASAEVASTRMYMDPENILLGDRNTDSRYMLGRHDSFQAKVEESYSALMKELLCSKPESITECTSDDFIKLCIRKEMTIQYYFPIPGELFCWYMGADYKNYTGPQQIWRVVIAPHDQDRQQRDSIYLYDGKLLYLYYFEASESSLAALSKESMDEEYNRRKLLSINKVYSFAEEVLSDLARGDLPILVKEYTDTSFTKLKSEVPEIFELVSSESFSDYEVLAQAFLGAETELYIPSKNESIKAVNFRKIGSIANIYSDGFFEFTQDSNRGNGSKGSIVEAYGAAVEYIAQRTKIMSGTNSRGSICLTGLDEEQDGYIFTFNYLISVPNGVGDIQVKLDGYNTESARNPLLSDAITVKSSAAGVYEIAWLGTELKNGGSYNGVSIGFDSMIDRVAYRVNIDFASNRISEGELVYRLAGSGEPILSFFAEIEYIDRESEPVRIFADLAD